MKSGDTLRTKYGSNMREFVITRPPTSSPAGSDPHPNSRRDAPSLKHALLIPIDRIIPDPDQPRREFDDESLGELAESLKNRGQLQPVRVRWDEPSGNWVLIVGERRWRAAKLAGLSALQAVEVSGTPDPSETLEDQLVENCIRKGLLPIEQARAFKVLMDTLGLSHRALADKLHIAHSAVTQALALLRLPEAVQDTVDSGALAPSAAYEVAKLESPDEQVALAERVVNENMTRSEVIEEVRERKATPKSRTQHSDKSKQNVTSYPTPPAEITVGGGRKVIVVGAPVDAGPEALLLIVQLAADKLKAEIAATK